LHDWERFIHEAVRDKQERCDTSLGHISRVRIHDWSSFAAIDSPGHPFNGLDGTGKQLQHVITEFTGHFVYMPAKTAPEDYE
jgi:hypothetical protein